MEIDIDRLMNKCIKHQKTQQAKKIIQTVVLKLRLIKMLNAIHAQTGNIFYSKVTQQLHNFPKLHDVTCWLAVSNIAHC